MSYSDFCVRHIFGKNGVFGFKRVTEALDGTYRLNPQNPSVMHCSGMPDTHWPLMRERIIEENKHRMAKDALLFGVSEWIDNAINYLNTKDIIDEYKQQFPEMYNYFIKQHTITYETMKTIHNRIDQSIINCENSKEVKDKRKKIEDEKKEKAKLLIEYYRNKDYDCNILFLEIEKNYMKSRKLYEEYFTLKTFKEKYNKNNKLYNILYNNFEDHFLICNANLISSMHKTGELIFLQYLTVEKIKYIQNLIKI
jgi:hypothetical protein